MIVPQGMREQERSNSANVIFRTALGKHDALEARLLGLGGPSPGPFFWPHERVDH
jgi:hypothetical protein